MDKETKKYLQHIFSKRLNKNRTLPRNQQFEHILHKETEEEEYKYENTTKKLLKLELGMCPECTNTTYVIDYHRGERVCPQCGFVFSNIVFETPRFIIKPKNENNIYPQKYMKFSNNKKYLYMTEAKEWKKRQVEREIDVISTALQLSVKNKKSLHSIIESVGLKKLHSKANMTTIICGVARYLLKNTENNPLVNLRYDRGIFKDNLTRDEYRIVEKNIFNFFGDKYAYKPNPKKKKKKNTKTTKNSKSEVYFTNQFRRAKKNKQFNPRTIGTRQP